MVKVPDESNTIGTDAEEADRKEHCQKTDDCSPASIVKDGTDADGTLDRSHFERDVTNKGEACSELTIEHNRGRAGNGNRPFARKREALALYSIGSSVLSLVAEQLCCWLNQASDRFG